MTYDYDKLYREMPHALGAPTDVFVSFFDGIESAKRVLDIGCGQGRDALFIAARGHSVVGVDLSSAGVNAMIDDAKDKSLDVTGIVADIRAFLPDGLFDIILIDRTLHMLDAVDRREVLRRLLNHVGPEGYVLISDETSNMGAFKDVFSHSDRTWRSILDHKGNLFLQVD